jgi:dihydroneopterin aldolase
MSLERADAVHLPATVELTETRTESRLGKSARSRHPGGAPTVFIRDMKVEVVIGAYSEEREAARTVIVDLDIELNHALASRSDRLEDTIDYGAVVHAVRAHAAAGPFHLLERFADEIAALILDTFGARRVRVTAAKSGMFAGVGPVGVTLARPAKRRTKK